LFVMVEYYSRYVEVDVMRLTTSDKIIKTLKKMFITHGLPLRITTDNGPQFISEEFKSYVDEQNIKHRRVTPLCLKRMET